MAFWRCNELTQLKNFERIVFTEGNTGSSSGVILIKSEKDQLFPEYSKNYSFQGGGVLIYPHRAHEVNSKI